MENQKSPAYGQNKPEKQNDLTFPTALFEVIGERRITKREWGNEGYYCYRKDGFLKLHKPDGKDYDWIISDGDLLGIDWYVL